VRHELRGVGENYRDHYAPRMNWRVTLPITLNEQGAGERKNEGAESVWVPSGEAYAGSHRENLKNGFIRHVTDPGRPFLMGTSNESMFTF
jgi:hypothetical protein